MCQMRQEIANQLLNGKVLAGAIVSGTTGVVSKVEVDATSEQGITIVSMLPYASLGVAIVTIIYISLGIYQRVKEIREK